ncbi:DNA-directed RNA polymerase I core subunit rpa12 [Coemansia erecta]|uniref:DNA-directed RNA polymerase I subunit RPA12 n=1 Tax=Coemansia erecta TaxID=147472 RepID=A0A9W8CSC8_9FUNG|nr:DNA-directed RNA polymerase I core subunit rpa12 [Coemansia erecta]
MTNSSSVAAAASAAHSASDQRRTHFGSLIFCSTCGNLLDNPGDQDHIVCHACGDARAGTEFEGTETVSRSQDSAFPSRLRNKRSLVQGVGASTERVNARVEETCPRCGENEMTFYTMQMRSADEGQTVFYSCVKCGHGYSIKN